MRTNAPPGQDGPHRGDPLILIPRPRGELRPGGGSAACPDGHDRWASSQETDKVLPWHRVPGAAGTISLPKRSAGFDKQAGCCRRRGCP